MSSEHQQNDRVVGSADLPDVIVAKQLGKSYRLYRHPVDRLLHFFMPNRKKNFASFTALHNVTFELKKGEVLGVIGVNGAGKSTLLQLISGALHPSEGQLETQGRIAAILELGAGFNPDFSGRENIYLNAATIGLEKYEIESRLDSIIDFAGIGDHIDQPVKTYSSGMQVRLAFAIATSVDADILIIDEALSVGDGAFRRKSFDRIMEIRKRGTSILFCSHVLFHIEAFCDRVLWLHRGKIQRLGALSEVILPYQDFIDAYSLDGSAQPTDAPRVEQSTEALKVNKAPDFDHSAGQSVRFKAPQNDARFTEVTVSLDGVTGKELSGTSLLSTLEVSMRFASDPSIPSPTAALVLSTEGGKIVGTALSKSASLLIPRTEDGIGYISATISRIPLNKGRYRVGVYLFCERAIHGYDMIDPVAHVMLEHHGSEQGACLFQTVWEAHL
ncbi:MAG: ATP-binding cassette domain-containing protein [Betaproteobacteria bacterium]|nr:ATP-binding cassette domain-containing protein [Betaproteobacteria bacterium]